MSGPFAPSPPNYGNRYEDPPCVYEDDPEPTLEDYYRSGDFREDFLECPFCGRREMNFVQYGGNRAFELNESAIECPNCLYELWADSIDELEHKWNWRKYHAK